MRRIAIASLRLPAVILGVFMIVTSAADILGFVPYSNKTPTIGHRIATSAPSLSYGVVALVPYRMLGSLLSRIPVAALLWGSSLLFLWISIGGVLDYIAGGKHVAIVYTGLVMTAIIVMTLIAFYCIIWKPQREYEPNQALK